MTTMIIAYYNFGTELEYMKEYQQAIQGFSKGYNLAIEEFGTGHPLASTLQ
jgi:hypothetical protein